MAEVQILERICPKCNTNGFYRHDEDEEWQCCNWDCDEIYDEQSGQAVQKVDE